MAPGSGLLSTQALSRGYTDRGLYGYRHQLREELGCEWVFILPQPPGIL